MDKQIPDLREGQVVKVVQKIVEAKRERNVPFTGVVQKVRGSGSNKTITVKQTLEGVEVDRIFSVAAPSVTSIDIIEQKEKITKKIKRTRKLRAKKK